MKIKTSIYMAVIKYQLLEFSLYRLMEIYEKIFQGRLMVIEE